VTVLTYALRPPPPQRPAYPPIPHSYGLLTHRTSTVTARSPSGPAQRIMSEHHVAVLVTNTTTARSDWLWPDYQVDLFDYPYYVYVYMDCQVDHVDESYYIYIYIYKRLRLSSP
jgi:hypothetical protein